jgi:hypothetical protein
MRASGYDHNTGLVQWIYAGTAGNLYLLSYSEDADDWFFHKYDLATDNIPWMLATGPYFNESTINLQNASQDVHSSVVELRYNTSGTRKVSIGSRVSPSYEPWTFLTKRIMLDQESSVSVNGVRLIANLGDVSDAEPPGLSFSIEYSNDPYFKQSSTVSTTTASSNGWRPVMFDAQFCRVTVSGSTTTEDIPDALLALQFDVSQGGNLGL